MTENTGPQGQNSPPETDTPTEQTTTPPVQTATPTEDECEDIDDTAPPVLTAPDPCFKPDAVKCNCPSEPGTSSTCLDDLIADQAKEIAAAEKAKTFKTDLEALQGKVKTAAQEYTKDKYDALVKLWVQRDDELVELIRKLVCAVPCWRCIVECYVCPLISDLYVAEQRLYGGNKLLPPAMVTNLYDVQYWHARDKDAKERRFQRIKAVLAAWEKPAQTLEKILSDNKTAIEEAGKLLASDPGKVTYDVFLKIVPLHRAIAPLVGVTTKIKEEYTKFCDCETGTPDLCCGIDVGDPSWQQRLIGPQPYLVDHNRYSKIICCLAEKRYGPAKDALAESIAEGARVDDQIKRYKEQVEKGFASFEKDAKRVIPSAITCCDDKLGPCPPPKPAPAPAVNQETSNA